LGAQILEPGKGFPKPKKQEVKKTQIKALFSFPIKIKIPDYTDFSFLGIRFVNPLIFNGRNGFFFFPIK